MELVSEGLHGLATAARVPLLTMRLSDGLWLMNKAGQLQLEHFNKSNALELGHHHGSVRHAGYLLGAGLEPNRWRIILHPAWPPGPIRMDGARRPCLPDSRR